MDARKKIDLKKLQGFFEPLNEETKENGYLVAVIAVLFGDFLEIEVFEKKNSENCVVISNFEISHIKGDVPIEIVGIVINFLVENSYGY